MRRMWLAVLVGLVVACGATGADDVSPTTVSPTTTTTVATTTSTTVVKTTTAAKVVLAEGVKTRLSVGVTYRWEMNGLMVEVTPPTDGWEVLYYRRTGSEAGALIGWRGPSGLRSETLDVLFRDFADDGIQAAWERVDAIGEAGRESSGGSWTLEDEGSAAVGGVSAEWREYRTPPRTGEIQRFSDDIHFRYSLLGANETRLLLDTSVRFFVVPIRGSTVTVAGYETRCACLSSPTSRYDRGAQIGDDVENELSMWIDELEAFLAHVEFVER